MDTESILNTLTILIVLLAAARAAAHVARAWDASAREDIRVTPAKRSEIIRRLAGRRTRLWVVAGLVFCLVPQTYNSFGTAIVDSAGVIEGSFMLYALSDRVFYLSFFLNSFFFAFAVLLLLFPRRRARPFFFIGVPVLSLVANMAVLLIVYTVIDFIPDLLAYRLYYPAEHSPTGMAISMSESPHGLIILSVALAGASYAAWRWLLARADASGTHAD